MLNAEIFSETIDNIATEYSTTSLSIAVFSNNQVIYTHSYGFSDKELNIYANRDTKYRAASISKIITAICAMILVDEGRLDLDLPISEIIGFNLDNSKESLNTTKHLLTHTSSIVDGSAYENAFKYNPPKSLSQLASNFNIFSNNLPGSRYLYSNFGAGIVSAVIESVTGERFYNFAENELFNKLEMDAGFLRTLIDDTDNIANIYNWGKLAYNVKSWGRIESYYDLIPLGQQYALGQCELIISSSDLARIGIILSGNGTFGGVRILSEETVKEMNNPYISVVNSNGFTTTYSYSLRSSNNIVENRTITGHPGQAMGMVGGLYFDSSDGTGVAILTNGCSVTIKENDMYGINDDIVKAVYKFFFD